jgi:hypothetical protein
MHSGCLCGVACLQLVSGKLLSPGQQWQQVLGASCVWLLLTHSASHYAAGTLHLQPTGNRLNCCSGSCIMWANVLLPNSSCCHLLAMVTAGGGYKLQVLVAIVISNPHYSSHPAPTATCTFAFCYARHCVGTTMTHVSNPGHTR